MAWRLSLRQLNRYLTLAGEIRAAESQEEALVALFPHTTAEGRVRLQRAWQAGARPASETPGGQATAPRPSRPTVPVYTWDDLPAFFAATAVKR